MAHLNHVKFYVVRNLAKDEEGLYLYLPPNLVDRNDLWLWRE